MTVSLSRRSSASHECSPSKAFASLAMSAGSSIDRRQEASDSRLRSIELVMFSRMDGNWSMVVVASVMSGISAGNSHNSYRGLVQIMPSAANARNFSQCDSLLMTDTSGAHTFPYVEVKNPTAQVEHEATTSKIGEDQIFYCLQRGIDAEQAISLIVNGYAKEVLNQLPMEFAVEAQKLLSISLEGSVG